MGWFSRSQEPKGIFFGGMVVPDEHGEGGFMLVGMPGVGKTTVIDLLLRQVLTPILWETRLDRALLYDPKREYISKLQHLGLYDPVSAVAKGSGFDKTKHRDCVIITNPTDQRAFAWDIAKDFDHELDAQQLATIFTEGTGDAGKHIEFFETTAQQLFGAAFVALHRLKRGKWTLRDLILAFRHRDDTKSLLCQFPDTEATFEHYLGDNIERTNTGPSVHATLHNYLESMSAVAASWHAIVKAHPDRTFSFRKWVDGRSVIVLGASDRHGKHLQLVNRLMFHKASIELFEHRDQDNPNRNTWVFLDEITELGYLERLALLMRKGRSWGVRCVYAFQEYSDLERAFTPLNAQTITSLAHTIGALNCSADTAGWVSRKFGEYLDPEGRDRPRVRWGDIHDLTATPREHGTVGWYYSNRLPERRVQRHQLDPNDVRKALLPRNKTWDIGFDRPDGSFALPPWEPGERPKLKLDTPKAKPPAGDSIKKVPTANTWLPPRDKEEKPASRSRTEVRDEDMADDGMKARKVKWQGKTLHFRCTDEAFPMYEKNAAFLNELWLDAVRFERMTTEERIEHSFNEIAINGERKDRFRMLRTLEWNGRTLQWCATDEEYEKQIRNNAHLFSLWVIAGMRDGEGEKE